MRWLLRGLSRPGALPPDTLPAYAAMGHWSLQATPLESRLELLIQQLSAELSACAWCLYQARHRWRTAFLSEQALHDLRGYLTSPAFSERERAALALTEAVAHYRSADTASAREALIQARHHFGEAEVARIVQAAAGEHFFNPATGRLGLEVGEAGPHEAGYPASGEMPWPAIVKGITMRGWR